MKMVLTKEQRLLIRKVVDGGDAEVYENYSGRCMYGEKCFGIETFQYISPVSVMMKLAKELIMEYEFELLDKLANNVHQDSMGLGSIIYFPSVKWKEKVTA